MKLQYFIGQNSLSAFNQWIDKQNYSDIFLLTDENTNRHCLPVFSDITQLKARLINIPAGEKAKNIKSCSYIWEKLLDEGADRKSLLINLGGGMISDIGGFCAYTYMRGIDYVNVPTSLIGMIDAAIGGKTAVDFHHYKNILGGFYEPHLTVIFPGFLNTLPQRQLKAAFGEIIKYNLLNPFILFDELYSVFGAIPDEQLIKSCINTKIEVVRDDPYETKGLREVLNLGHTFGHAFETLALEKNHELLHGEAVALGIVAEMLLSEKIFPLSKKQHKHEKPDFSKLLKFVLTNFDKSFLGVKDIDRLLTVIKKDKKNTDGKCRFILIDDHDKVKPINVEEGMIVIGLEQFVQM